MRCVYLHIPLDSPHPTGVPMATELSSPVHPVDQNLPLGKLSALGLQHVLVI